MVRKLIENGWFTLSMSTSLLFLLQIIQIKAKVSFHQENGEERLNDLARCCVENDILDIIDLDTVLNNFASRVLKKSLFIMRV
jgi:hypothetical protein